jgi:hypothetical protein
MTHPAARFAVTIPLSSDPTGVTVEPVSGYVAKHSRVLGTRFDVWTHLVAERPVVPVISSCSATR